MSCMAEHKAHDAEMRRMERKVSEKMEKLEEWIKRS